MAWATALVSMTVTMTLLAWGTACEAASPDALIDQTLQNITTLVRPGRVGYAAIRDGNKYVQCRRMPDRAKRCEAAGAALQPSLKAVLNGARLNRLAALGWSIDPAFGNYVRLYPSNMATATVAKEILNTLVDGYGAQPDTLEFNTAWIVDVPCPPRNGPSQNLAGLINNAREMGKSAITACAYKAPGGTSQKVASASELIALNGTEVTAEIQRLRINAAKRVHVIFDSGIGYVQCMPETPPATLNCEAQSAESWPALSALLTPERIAMLRNAGYTDPGRAPNYWKSYAFDKFTDAAVAQEILTILFEVYGYTGVAKFKVLTESN